MALADFIKACTLSESNSLKGSSYTSTTTQVVGLLSVLAISGSVALFTLGGKLRLTGVHASPPLKMDGRDGLIRAEATASEPSKMDGRDLVKENRKRVHFADDVVEPQGDSREYRQRFAQRHTHEERVGRSNSMPDNRIALYRGLRQYQLQHSATYFS